MAATNIEHSLVIQSNPSCSGLMPGVRAGVPDLFLAFPVRPYAGLFIEMKRHEGGRVSPSQKIFIQMLQNAGYYVAVCRGFEYATKTIIQYLRGELEGESNETTDREDEGEAER